jgi:hypothetical protein
MLELTKAERIKRESTRIKRLLKEVPAEKLKAADGVIKRVAFMHATLEDLEADINEYGTTEMFSQTAGVEYERERPATRIYNATIKNYQAACKQLFDLIPEAPKSTESDELMSFLKKVKR